MPAPRLEILLPGEPIKLGFEQVTLVRGMATAPARSATSLPLGLRMGGNLKTTEDDQEIEPDTQDAIQNSSHDRARSRSRRSVLGLLQNDRPTLTTPASRNCDLF